MRELFASAAQVLEQIYYCVYKFDNTELGEGIGEKKETRLKAAKQISCCICCSS